MITVFLSDHYLKESEQNSDKLINNALQEVRSKSKKIYVLESRFCKKRWGGLKTVEFVEYEVFNTIKDKVTPFNKCHIMAKFQDKEDLISFLNNLSEVL